MENNITKKEICDKFLDDFLSKACASNWKRITICRSNWSFRQYISDMRYYLNDDILDAVKLNGYVFRYDLSDEEMLVFDKN